MSKDKDTEHPRSFKFSDAEVEKLVSLVEARKQIITTKELGPALSQEKKSAWLEIEKEYNNPGFGGYRNARQLRVKYEALKRGVTKKLMTGSPLNPLEVRVRVFMVLSDRPKKKGKRVDNRRGRKRSKKGKTITNSSKNEEIKSAPSIGTDDFRSDSEDEPLIKIRSTNQNSQQQTLQGQFNVVIKKELEEDKDNLKQNDTMQSTVTQGGNVDSSDIQNVWIKQEVDDESNEPMTKLSTGQITVKIEPVKEEEPTEEGFLEIEIAPSTSTQETIGEQSNTNEELKITKRLHPAEIIDLKIRKLEIQMEHEQKILLLKKKIAESSMEVMKAQIRLYEWKMKYSSLR